MSPDLHLLEPYALVLLLPALAAWWLWARQGHGRWLRLTVLLLLVLAAARPELAWERGGSDVVVILDRSASLGEARQPQAEMLRLVGEQRGTGDRLGVVLLGDSPVIAQGPQHTGIPLLSDHPVRDSGSDIAGALDQAASLLSPSRSARVIIHSDGEATGVDPRAAATRLGLGGVPVDVLVENRPPTPDAAVIDVELPADLHGQVLVADPKWDFVVLNVGQNQGVLEDGIMLVNRNGRLVAKVQVRSVQSDRSIANVLPNWKLGDVMEGDQVIP